MGLKIYSKWAQNGLKINSKFAQNWLKIGSKSYFRILCIFSRTKCFLKDFVNFQLSVYGLRFGLRFALLFFGNSKSIEWPFRWTSTTTFFLEHGAGPNPYRHTPIGMFFEKTQSPQYRAHTPIGIFSEKLKVFRYRAHTPIGIFPEKLKVFRYKPFYHNTDVSRRFLYELFLRNMSQLLRYYCRFKLIVLIVWVRKNLL